MPQNRRDRFSNNTIISTGAIVLLAIGFMIFAVRATSWQIKNETEQETERKFVSGMIHLWAKYDGAQSTLNRRGEETRAWQLVTRPELDAVMTGLADEHGEVRGYLTEPGKDTVPMVWWPKMNGQWCANPSIKKLVGTTFNLEFKGKVQPNRSHRHYFFIKGAGETPGGLDRMLEIWHRVNE